MKLNKKRELFILAFSLSVLLLIGGVAWIGRDVLYDVFNPSFDETTIFPDEAKEHPHDTTFTVNNIEFKMIGVKGGKINCTGLRKTIELKDFFIGETEVTQRLWKEVMGYNPSENQDSILNPVENVDLVECLTFVHRLDSITGVDFYVQSYPEFLYAAYLGGKDDEMCWVKENANNTSHPVKQKIPNSLGIYDLFGNVSEWTISGSDPLFFVMGGSYKTEKGAKPDSKDIYHAKVKGSDTGLRLVCYPKK